MKIIEKIYKPFNFSARRCYVISLSVGTNGYMKIEHKLPAFVQNLKGIFVSVNYSSGNNVAGYISLNFNGQTLKAFHKAVLKTFLLKNCSRPFSFNEIIQRNSFLQGYYFDTSGGVFPYSLKIYLYYEPETVKQ